MKLFPDDSILDPRDIARVDGKELVEKELQAMSYAIAQFTDYCWVEKVGWPVCRLALEWARTLALARYADLKAFFAEKKLASPPKEAFDGFTGMSTSTILEFVAFCSNSKESESTCVW